MVTGPSLTDDDRAQLVLVGSVAIAFIIISLVVVFNTVLFTNNLAARGSVEEVEDASTFQQQVEREVPEFVRHVENGTASNAALVGNVDENVTEVYSGLLAESYADTSPTYADVTFNESSTVNGTRVVQDDGGDFTNESGFSTWEPVEQSDPRNLSKFVVTVNTTQDNLVSTDNFTVTLRSEGASEPAIELEMYSALNDSLILNQYEGGTLSNTCVVSDGDNRIDVNVSNGSVHGSSTCTFDSLGGLTAPYSVGIGDGDASRGNYSYVVNGTMKSNPHVAWDRDGPTTPYANWVLIEAGVDLYFESRTVTYESNQTVTVREGPQ